MGQYDEHQKILAENERAQQMPKHQDQVLDTKLGSSAQPSHPHRNLHQQLSMVGEQSHLWVKAAPISQSH